MADNGVGMSAEVQARAFERFFTTKSADRGTGLGLASAHDIVSAHGGSIGVESTPGTGTSVTFRLPINQRGQPRRSERTAATGPGSDPGSDVEAVRDGDAA